MFPFKFLKACYSIVWHLTPHFISEPRKLQHPLPGAHAGTSQFTISPPRSFGDVVNITQRNTIQTTLLTGDRQQDRLQKLHKLASNQFTLLGRKAYWRLEYCDTKHTAMD